MSKEALDYGGQPWWAEKLAAAGSRFDGHVTIGSFYSLIKAVKEILAEEESKWEQQTIE